MYDSENYDGYQVWVIEHNNYIRLTSCDMGIHQRWIKCWLSDIETTTKEKIDFNNKKLYGQSWFNDDLKSVIEFMK